MNINKLKEIRDMIDELISQQENEQKIEIEVTMTERWKVSEKFKVTPEELDEIIETGVYPDNIFFALKEKASKKDAMLYDSVTLDHIETDPR